LTHFCGDDVRTENELCDGTDLGGKTCTDLGFYGQTTGLACAADCTFDKSGCIGACGDQKINGSEACDGADLGGADCASLGFYEPAGLRCSPYCTYDVSGCIGFCGDGSVNGPDEQCDGAPPDGKTCLDFGYDRGLLGCSALCNPSTSGCSKLGWQSVTSATGPGGSTISYWDGSTWSTASSLPTVLISPTIWGSGPNDAWAAGFGPILHWDGLSWSVAFDDPSRPELWWISVWGTGASDVYVLGADIDVATLVNHWDGLNWSETQLPLLAPGNAEAIWGSASNDVYVVGSDGTVHWDGTRWSILSIGGNLGFHSIWGDGPQNVYVAGDSGVFRWDGTSWTKIGEATGSHIFGRSGQDVYVVTPNMNGTTSTVSHWDGSSWSPVYEGSVGGGWESSKGEIYLDGSYGLLTPTTAQWIPVGEVEPTSMWGSGEDVFWVEPGQGYATGRFGAIHLDAPPTSQVDTKGLTSPDRIWGTGPNDIWGLDSHVTNEIYRWMGSSWVPAKTFSNSGMLQFKLNAIGGAAPDNLWAVGDVVIWWDGQTWWVPDPAKVTLSSVWARSTSDVYAVGAGGYIQHWDGTSWSAMNSPTTNNLHDVWGTSKDVFVTGDGGTVLRLGSDNKWTSMPTHTDEVDKIRGSGPGNVFASAISKNTQLLLHLRGGVWEPIAAPPQLIDGNLTPPQLPAGIVPPPALDNRITALWVTPTSVYVAGPSTGKATLFRLNLRGVDCQAPELDCSDGWDNDCDGLQDGADPDCAGRAPVEQCANLADDDGDGLIDCADPDCAHFPSCRNHK
jgi:hypothetical protein